MTQDTLSLKRDIEGEAQSISHALEDDPLFMKAMTARRHEDVAKHLKLRMDAYSESRRGGAIIKVFVYGPTLDFVAQSPQMNYRGLIIPGMCPRIREQALRLVGHGKNAIVHGICRSGNKNYVVSVIPLSGLASDGFIEVIAMPQKYFSVHEKKLGMPIQVTSENGGIIFQSGAWPAALQDDAHQMVSVKFAVTDGNGPLRIKAAHNIEMLQSDLSRVSYYVLVVAAVVTLLVIVVSISVLQKRLLTRLPSLRTRWLNYAMTKHCWVRKLSPKVMQKFLNWRRALTK